MTVKRTHLEIAALFAVVTLVVAFSPMAAQISGYFLCTSRNVDTGDCLTIWNGGGISVYKNPGNSAVFTVNGENGNSLVGGSLDVKGYIQGDTTFTVGNTQQGAIYVMDGSGNYSAVVSGTGITTTGLVQATVVKVNGTPVFWVTPQPTPTPLIVSGIITATSVRAAEVSVNGTPVFWATPQPAPTAQTLFMGASAGQYQQCGTVSVTDAATVTPEAGVTPVYVVASLQTITGDAAAVSGIVGSGVITITVKGNEATPVANTTPANVNYCIIGTKP